ncbi:MAG: DUF1963 domain-containing protein [Bacteroidia bacterium]|nr:DUF1963 domain-containing protein [Bacteroidia bacterium]
MILHEAFVPFRNRLLATALDSVSISIGNPILSNPSPRSKLGGLPWWPSSKPYPTAPDGLPLHLLAQINLAELPNHPNQLPTEGLLQVFLHPTDPNYGLSIHDRCLQAHWQVVYHPTTLDASTVRTTFEELSYDDFVLPFEPRLAFALDFKAVQKYLNPTDVRFQAFFPELCYPYEFPDEALDSLYKTLVGFESQIGGYPVFIQDDPRLLNPDLPSDGRFQFESCNTPVLLLQLASETEPRGGHYPLMWGDVGVANWFIEPEDLAARRFERVFYTWDCS